MAQLEREIVWIGHDNENAFILKANGSAVDLSGATAMKLSIDDQVIMSTNSTAQYIVWNQATYQTGETHLLLGGNTSLSPGNFDARLVVYDSLSTDGIVWGDTIPLCIKRSATAT